MNAGWNIESDRKRGGKCRAILLPDKLVTRNNGLFLQKHSSLTAAFNDEYFNNSNNKQFSKGYF